MVMFGFNGVGKFIIIGIIILLVNKMFGSVSIYGCDVDVDFFVVKMYIGVVF